MRTGKNQCCSLDLGCSASSTAHAHAKKGPLTRGPYHEAPVVRRLSPRVWRLLSVVDRYVVVFPAGRMRALLRESQRLAIFRHSANPGTDGRTRFRLDAVDGQGVDARYGHHIEIRVSAGRVGFAIILEGQRRGRFLTVRRRRFYGQRNTLRRFSVNARLALGRRTGRECRFREIQFPRPDYSIRRKRRARPDRKDGSDEQSFD
jgi:hypothetical protein